MFNEDDSYSDVLRHHNRTLRRVHKNLRSSLKSAREYSDNLFLELCNSDKEAELNFEKLWTLGGFKNVCGPKDYKRIVEVCLTVLGKTSSIDEV